MKKTQVRAIIILVIVLIIACIGNTDSHAEVDDHREFYPRLTVVIAKEWNELFVSWNIYCQDKDGNLWIFYDDAGDWDCGDICNLLMWNTGESEEEDEIIEVYWEGYTEDIVLWFNANGWR